MVFKIDVKKSFLKNGRREFLLDVSTSFDDGITILEGESGAGKTTTLKIIAGIIMPDEGVIDAGGVRWFDSSERINLSIQKRNVGFVFQDYALFPHLTAEENIAYGVKSPSGRTRLETANEKLALFNLGHIRHRRPRELSGGEQQRVALARALASEPSIVLLDEPLSAVDVDNRSRLLDEIEQTQNRAPIPFIYVTHNHAEANRLGTKRIMLKNGRVSENGHEF